jgi:hypothetical protein
MSKMKQALDNIYTLKGIMSTTQLAVIGDGCRRSEREFFFEKLEELATIFKTMPKTYEQDGKGDKAIAYLHYFVGSHDWYITEKDMEDAQHQAYGLVINKYGAETGYISLIELKRYGAELDLHFTPTCLAEIKAEKL